MTNFLDKIIGDKKEWRAMEARAKALPHEFEVAYEEIKQYVWKTGGIDGIDLFKGILDLFEEGAAHSQHVLDITGTDVAAFCDELMRGKTTYTEKWRQELNENIAKKISE
jgi:DNA-binding ferritin-like protein (Dps family)